MKTRDSARLSDVARAADVSLSTASRALADPGLVRPETREKVRQAAELLRYVPHGAARALASRRSRTIGAVVPTLDNPIFANSIQTLQRSLGEAGYTLLLASHEYDALTEISVTRTLIERGVDGLMFVGTDHSPEFFQLLAQSGVPFELTWAIDPNGHHYCVGFSNRSAAIRVAQYLLDLGHTNIAMISGFTANNDRARERVAGVRDALAARGLALADDHFVETAFSVGSGRAALRTLLAHDPSITAVVGGNDILALGALVECAARGVSVPRELSVTGFDDIELAGEISPALTTIHVPTAEIGRRAAERLLARLEGRRVKRGEELPVDLVIRESSGPPPKRAPGAGKPSARQG